MEKAIYFWAILLMAVLVSGCTNSVSEGGIQLADDSPGQEADSGKVLGKVAAATEEVPEEPVNEPELVPASEPAPAPVFEPEPEPAASGTELKSIVEVIPAPGPVSGFRCDCSKACTKMESCEEAYYQLNSCGCQKRDNDNDGVPCESVCSGG